MGEEDINNPKGSTWTVLSSLILEAIQAVFHPKHVRVDDKLTALHSFRYWLQHDIHPQQFLFVQPPFSQPASDDQVANKRYYFTK